MFPDTTLAMTNPTEDEVFNKRWFPYSGFHDEHRSKEHTADYLPAVQQSRDELYALLGILRLHPRKDMLQLGLGRTAASHEMWRTVFQNVVTIDIQVCLTGASFDGAKVFPGLNTHRIEALRFAARFGPYDFLFIDAGHKFDDLRMDFKNYKYMVRPGGIIAFGNALRRSEEIEVWKFLNTISGWTMIGSEIGIAWMVRGE